MKTTALPPQTTAKKTANCRKEKKRALKIRVAKTGTEGLLVTEVTYFQGSKRTKKVFEVAYVRMIYPHSLPAIQIDSKKKKL